MFRRPRREEIVGFAFSGGGARGATQAGALKALHEAKIFPAIVAGTSAGAVNAAWYALHPDQVDHLRTIWTSVRTRDVFPGSGPRLLMNMARSGFMHHAHAWEATLRRYLGYARFEDTAIPLAVTAVRLSDGQCVVFDSGEIVPALMASTAIPAVLPPHRIDGHMYVDGGVLEYLPVPTLVERGATTIYALDCSWFPVEEPSERSAVDRAGLVASAAAVQAATSLGVTRGRTVHVLRPETLALSDGRDFSSSAELIEAGYRHALQYLQDRALLNADGDSAG